MNMGNMTWDQNFFDTIVNNTAQTASAIITTINGTVPPVSTKSSIWPLRAICRIQNYNGQSNLRGFVKFEQINLIEGVDITVNIDGLYPNETHGLHIHEFGDLSNGCETLGMHYNPFNQSHGDRYGTPRHQGDLGNVLSNENGTVNLTYLGIDFQLAGPYSVIGRGCSLHNGTDELYGGHSVGGPKLACGVIGVQ